MKHFSVKAILGAFIGLSLIILSPSEVLLCQGDPAAEWDHLYVQIRDGLISKGEARIQLKELEGLLKDLWKKDQSPVSDHRLCFPVEGYGPNAIGGKGGNGYQAKGYDFFDGNRHKAHPSQDIFIRDKDQDGRDDMTRKPVYVLSASSGIVVSVFLDWQPGSPIRGGNYIWIYEPDGNRYYYYAHLNEISVRIGQVVSRGARIGTVGRTGTNAYPHRSPTHLHFTVYHSEGGDPKPVNPYKELIGSVSHRDGKKTGDP